MNLITIATALATLVPASIASAAVTPSITLDQSAGTQAAGTFNLGVDLKFADTQVSPPSGMNIFGTYDTPKDITLMMPPGLIAGATVDGGACLKTTTPITACQVGTGTVVANGVLDVPAVFDLVAPPAPGDLAGLQLVATNTSPGTPLGSPADVYLRSGASPGLSIAFSNVPDSYSGISIYVTEINSTFDNLRYPSSCPATPATIQVTADSYYDATPESATPAPLKVTGCSTAPYAPKYTLTATEDSGDSGVQITTTVTQAADELTSSQISLAFPVASLYANVYGVGDNGILCANPASGTCKSVGSATAVSPEYPTPLTGTAYLTGASLLSPSLTLIFPAPFALTLTGSVAVSNNQTTFTGIPDIPLTSLSVVLNGGPDSVYDGSCQNASGDATAAFTDQNGDPAVNVTSPFTIANCPAPTPTPTVVVKPSLSGAAFSGLKSGKPKLRFTLKAGQNAGSIRALTVKLPGGLSFIKVHHKIKGISVSGAKVAKLSLSHGRLTITLRAPVTAVTVHAGVAAIDETPALAKRVHRHKVKSLSFTVVTMQTTATTLTAKVAA